MLRSVQVRGPFTGPSGYDHHVREFVRALTAQGLEVGLENLVDWGPVQLPHRLRDPSFEAIPAGIDAAVELQFCFPTQVRPVAGRTVVNFTMFEATRIPRSWAEAHERADLIVVPTQQCLRAWTESGVPASKLRVCPLGVRVDLFRPGVRPLELGMAAGRAVGTYSARFLNVSELGARKNLSGLLRAWLRATTSDDDAVLVMKVGCYNPGSLAEFEYEKQTAERGAGQSLSGAAPVVYVYDLLPDLDMPRLFASASHYVSLSYGEGWDLSMIEAAAGGLRLIAPRHSGYVEYLDDDVATLLTARQAPAADGTGAWASELFEGVEWWAPDEDEAVQAIRRAIDGADEPRASARERVSDRFSWDAAAFRLLEILDEAEALTGRRQSG